MGLAPPSRVGWLLATAGLLLGIGSYCSLSGPSEARSNAGSVLSTSASAVSRVVKPGSRLRFAVQPLSGIPRVGALQDWLVSLHDSAGNPVSGCNLSLDGWMPAHGHGLPTKPQAKGEMEPGQYLVRGVRFSMKGVWQLELEARGCGDPDKATIDLDL